MIPRRNHCSGVCEQRWFDHAADRDGSFEFVEWTGVHIKFKKYKDYWVKGVPYVDELLVKILIDPVVRLNALKAGDVDLTHNLPMSEIFEYQKRPPKDFSILMGPTAGAHFISMESVQTTFQRRTCPQRPWLMESTRKRCCRRCIRARAMSSISSS